MIFATYLKPDKADLRFFFWLLFSILVFSLSLSVFLAPNRRRQRRTATKTTAAQRKPIFFGWCSLLLLHACICERVCESMCVPQSLRAPHRNIDSARNRDQSKEHLNEWAKNRHKKFKKRLLRKFFVRAIGQHWAQIHRSVWRQVERD